MSAVLFITVFLGFLFSQSIIIYEDIRARGKDRIALWKTPFMWALILFIGSLASVVVVFISQDSYFISSKTIGGNYLLPIDWSQRAPTEMLRAFLLGFAAIPIIKKASLKNSNSARIENTSIQHGRITSRQYFKIWWRSQF